MNGDAWNRFCRSARSCAEAWAGALIAAWLWANAAGAVSAAKSKARARHCFFRNLFIIICYLLLLRCYMDGSIVCYEFHQFQFNFGLKIVQFNIWSFRERLHKVQSVFSDEAVIKNAPRRKSQKVLQSISECL